MTYNSDIVRQNFRRPGVFKVDGEEHMYSKSFCGCSSESRIRVFCVNVMLNKWFDRFITASIVINSVLLATKEYKENYDTGYVSSWNELLEKFDLVFTVIFFIEFLIKVIAMGFVMSKNSYLRDSWNWIDFIIVFISMISLTPFLS